MIYKSKPVKQICPLCGKEFYLIYAASKKDDTRDKFSVWYEFVDEPCDCEASFFPAEGEPSISEWRKEVTS